MDHYNAITELRKRNDFVVATVKTDDDGGYSHKSGFVYDTNSEYVTLSNEGELSFAEYDDIIKFN